MEGGTGPQSLCLIFQQAMANAAQSLSLKEVGISRVIRELKWRRGAEVANLLSPLHQARRLEAHPPVDLPSKVSNILKLDSPQFAAGLPGTKDTSTVLACKAFFGWRASLVIGYNFQEGSSSHASGAKIKARANSFELSYTADWTSGFNEPEVELALEQDHSLQPLHTQVEEADSHSEFCFKVVRPVSKPFTTWQPSLRSEFILSDSIAKENGPKKEETTTLEDELSTLAKEEMYEMGEHVSKGGDSQLPASGENTDATVDDSKDVRGGNQSKHDIPEHAARHIDLAEDELLKKGTHDPEEIDDSGGDKHSIAEGGQANVSANKSDSPEEAARQNDLAADELQDKGHREPEIVAKSTKAETSGQAGPATIAQITSVAATDTAEQQPSLSKHAARRQRIAAQREIEAMIRELRILVVEAPQAEGTRKLWSNINHARHAQEQAHPTFQIVAEELACWVQATEQVCSKRA